MTKDEILKYVRNHCGEVRTIAAALEYEITALSAGYKQDVPGNIDSIKDMIDVGMSKFDEVKDILGQWPEDS